MPLNDRDLALAKMVKDALLSMTAAAAMKRWDTHGGTDRAGYDLLCALYRELDALDPSSLPVDRLPEDRDGERYRWLRNHPKRQFQDDEEKMWWPSVWYGDTATRPLQAGFLDDAVDAEIFKDSAIAKEPK